MYLTEPLPAVIKLKVKEKKNIYFKEPQLVPVPASTDLAVKTFVNYFIIFAVQILLSYT